MPQSPVPYGRLAPGRGNRNESTRVHNLSTVLSWVHHEPGVTRAELTRVTGLNRSTIGALVTELGQHALVYEGAGAVVGVGRPSPTVNPNPRVVALSINPDVDGITVGAVGLGGRVISQATRDLDAPPTVQDMLDLLPELVDEALSHGQVDRLVGAGVTVPGLVRRADGLVVRAPHLDWRDAPVAEDVARVLGLPTRVENDATAALIAESIFGGARGYADVVYLNGSASGIGGGVLTAGSIMLGADGFASELGHAMVAPKGERCHCGRRGCLEQEVNLRLLRAAAGVRRFGPGGLERHLSAGDNAAFTSEVDRQVDLLALGIANLVTVFNPSLVLLGGFLGSLWWARQERMRATVTANAFAPMADALTLAQVQLREDLLVVGGAELAFASVLSDPLGGGLLPAGSEA